MVLANVAVGRSWAPVATPILAVYAPLITGLIGGLDMLAAPFGAGLQAGGLSAQSRFAVDAGYIVTAVAAAGFVFKAIRRDLAAFVPIDPDNPVHALALSLATVFFGTQVTFILFTDVLASARSQPPLTILDLFLNEVPFLILGVAGVGIFVRRKAGDTTRRLGFVRPAWWNLVLALAAAGAFFALAQGSDTLNHLWAPAVARNVDSATAHIFGGLENPVGIFAVALIPGICEELLFRGALQPRIGLLATALLFTSIHTQYGFSVDTLAIFLIAVGLGIIRKYTNTTASCTCHVGYNLLAGFGIASAATPAAIAVEVILIAVAAWGFLAGRRRAAPAGQSS